MNYDEARALESGGWHWTTMNDGRVRPAWPCRRYVGDCNLEDLVAGNASPEDFETCEPHATREQAERHFYEACLEAVEEVRFGEWHGCAVCDQPTKAGLGNRLLSRYFRPDPLCDEHRNREQLAQLHPFPPDLSLTHS